MDFSGSTEDHAWIAGIVLRCSHFSSRGSVPLSASSKRLEKAFTPSGSAGVKASRPFATSLQKRLPGLMSSTVMRVPVAVPLTGEPRELPSGSKAKMVKVPL